MSSEVGLGDGLLVCTVLLLLWPKLELVMSMGCAFTSPKKNHQHKHKHRHRNQQDHPISKRSRARFPPGPLALLCLLAVGCGLLAVGLLLLLLLSLLSLLLLLSLLSLVLLLLLLLLLLLVVAALAAVVLLLVVLLASFCFWRWGYKMVRLSVHICYWCWCAAGGTDVVLVDGGMAGG